MKNRKIIGLFLIIALSFSLTSCQKEKYIPPNAQKYQYNYYPGTDWGMTEQEVMKSLGIKEKNISREGEMIENTADWSSFQIEQKVYGYPASIIFYFDKTKISEGSQIGLIGCRVIFQEEFDSEKISTFLKGELSSQGIQFNEHALGTDKPNYNIFYSSKATLKDIKKVPIFNEMEEILMKNFNVGNINEFFEAPISTASVETFEYDPNTKNLKTCQLDFGGYYPAILNNLE